MKIDLNNVQTHLDWLKQKLFLDTMSANATKRRIKRGQVYYCELGIGVGSELQKKRPCVIIQNDMGNIHSSVTTVVPITHGHKALNCFVPITDKFDNTGNLILDGSANVTAVRSIDKARIGDYICDVNSDELMEIEKALAINTDILKHYAKLQNMYNDKVEHTEKLNAILNDIKSLLDINDNKKIIEELKKRLDNNTKL